MSLPDIILGETESPEHVQVKILEPAIIGIYQNDKLIAEGYVGNLTLSYKKDSGIRIETIPSPFSSCLDK